MQKKLITEQGMFQSHLFNSPVGVPQSLQVRIKEFYIERGIRVEGLVNSHRKDAPLTGPTEGPRLQRGISA